MFQGERAKLSIMSFYLDTVGPKQNKARVKFSKELSKGDLNVEALRVCVYIFVHFAHVKIFVADCTLNRHFSAWVYTSIFEL